MECIFILSLILVIYLVLVLLCDINVNSYGKIALLHDYSLDNVVNQNNIGSPQINVGDKPIKLAINQQTNMVYVANSDSDSISVINGTTNEKIKDILVGKGPSHVKVNQE